MYVYLCVCMLNFCICCINLSSYFLFWALEREIGRKYRSRVHYLCFYTVWSVACLWFWFYCGSIYWSILTGMLTLHTETLGGNHVQLSNSEHWLWVFSNSSFSVILSADMSKRRSSSLWMWRWKMPHCRILWINLWRESYWKAAMHIFVKNAELRCDVAFWLCLTIFLLHC